MTVNQIGVVRSNAINVKNQLATNFPTTNWVLVTGSVTKSSMVPDFLSSAHNLIPIAGIKTRKSQGCQIKKEFKSACPLWKNWPIKKHIPADKARKTSKNIEAKSIVDKYLEHTRFFIFNSGGENKTYISSADWMTRNLDNRIEVTCPILDPNNKKEILEIFNIYWLDNLKSRKLNSLKINQYSKNKKEPIKSQNSIYNYYKKNLEK